MDSLQELNPVEYLKGLAVMNPVAYVALIKALIEPIDAKAEETIDVTPVRKE